MALAKRWPLASCVVLLASFAQAAAPDSNARALQLLIRALDRTSLKNIVAVMQLADMSQSSGSGSTPMQVVQVVIATDGRQRLTILEPLQQSGLVIVEDSGTRQIYNPDAKTLTTVSTDDFFDTNLRRRLISANYTVSMKENVPLVGRRVTRIDAVSKNMPGQSTQVFVDPESLFVLRVVVHQSPHESMIRFDTRSVSYPATLPANTFAISTPQGVTSKPGEAPVPVNSLAEAKARAGFTPVKPQNLPFGFVVHQTYVKQGTDYRLIGFELTDGLAMAIVFEFPAKNLPASLKAELKSPQSEFVRKGGLYIGIFTDLAPKVRKRLLASYRH